MTASSREVAVFGGSFDPPHLGHVFGVLAVLATTEVERVLVVPTFSHAFDKPLTAFEHRLRMCELAFEDVRRVEVSSIERDLPRPSYTIQTVEALAARHPSSRLRLVVGADVAAEFPRWHRHDEIARVAPLLVLGRHGYAAPGAVDVGLPDVSSSELRGRFGRGPEGAALMPRAVREYARLHGLYDVGAA